MVEQKLIECGKLVSCFKFYGELNWYHGTKKKDFLNTIKVVFIKESHGDIYIPYFIHTLRPKGEEVSIISFEDVNDEQQATKLKHKKVYLKEKDFKEFFISPDYEDFTGYTLYNDEQKIGCIEAVFNYGSQKTAEIIYNNEKKLLPLHDDFIIKIFKEKKEIHVILPNGMLEL